LTLIQRGALAEAIAASGRWERVAELCNIDPAAIRASTVGGQLAAAADCARALVRRLADNAYAVDRLRTALVNAELRSLVLDPKYGLTGEGALQ
jgi:hypothetical protein